MLDFVHWNIQLYTQVIQNLKADIMAWCPYAEKPFKQGLTPPLERPLFFECTCLFDFELADVLVHRLRHVVELFRSPSDFVNGNILL
ncbi:hypothetical protein ADUPG1_007549, partial [Aduncisulcus paluster]